MKPLSNNTVGQEMEQPPVAVNGGIPVTTGTNSVIPARNHLPYRRALETHKREHEGQPYLFSLGRDHNGVPAEIFITAIGKPGSGACFFNSAFRCTSSLTRSLGRSRSAWICFRKTPARCPVRTTTRSTAFLRTMIWHEQEVSPCRPVTISFLPSI